MDTHADTDRHCIGLTQLSSREQLSALMDGMLPEDQTRFLLRRLRHDTALAACWERWRIASDIMRGMTPERHLPADFALRVAAALQAPTQPSVRPAASTRNRWLWAGGGALAAALALLAVLPLAPRMTTPPAQTARASAAPSAQVASVPRPAPSAPATVVAPQVASVAASTAPVQVAAVARPATRAGSQLRRSDAVPVVPATASSPTEDAGLALAQPVSVPDTIVSRPWPRRILPQYGGEDGVTVGFGLPAQPARLEVGRPDGFPVLSAPFDSRPLQWLRPGSLPERRVQDGEDAASTRP